MTNEKIIGAKALSKILDLLYKYLPFKRKNILLNNGDSTSGIVQSESNIISNSDEIAFGTYNKTEEGIAFSIGIGTSDENRINAIHIKKTGEIHIFDEDTKTVSNESLYNIIKHAGQVTLVDTYNDITMYNKKENVGKLFYLTTNDTIDGITYYSGLYLISREITSTQMTTCIIALITSRQFNADLYYTKPEIDTKIDIVNNSIININNWINTNIISEEEIINIIK
jgi:uncharacterized protein YccT (UPF0319 family)